MGYESSIAFGMRKALMAEQRKAEIEATPQRRGRKNGGLLMRRNMRKRSYSSRKPTISSSPTSRFCYPRQKRVEEVVLSDVREDLSQAGHIRLQCRSFPTEDPT